MSPRQSSLPLSQEQVSGTGRALANPSPLIAVDASLLAAVRDSWCLPGGSSVCLSWWFARHCYSISWNISASTGSNRNVRDPSRPQMPTAPRSAAKKPPCLLERHSYIDLEVCVTKKLLMRLCTGSLTGINSSWGCRVLLLPQEQ